MTMMMKDINKQTHTRERETEESNRNASEKEKWRHTTWTCSSLSLLVSLSSSSLEGLREEALVSSIMVCSQSKDTLTMRVYVFVFEKRGKLENNNPKRIQRNDCHSGSKAFV